MTIACQKDKFQLDREVTYLNCAYMSPMLKSVEEAGVEGMLFKRSPNQVTGDHFFEGAQKLRAEFAKLVNCNDAKSCAVIASASYGIATVANNINLGKENEVLVLDEQFPSNYYTWDVLVKKAGAILKAVAPTAGKPRGKSWNENILKSINEKTKVVALPHVHWADGTKFDLEAIRKATNKVGAYLVIDGTQSVGALPFDVQKIQPDALVCAGYKWLMGPYSIGMAYYGERLKNGQPIEENWKNRLHSENFAGLVNYEAQYQPGNLRYEVGEHSNFILVPMMLKAIEQLNAWSPEAIQSYCESITKKPLEQLRNNGFEIEEEAYRGHHLFGVRANGQNVDHIKAQLEADKVSVSIRGSAIRISPHVYNTEEDMNKLVACLLK